MYLVGLTGGIGSGKSTAAQRFASHGCAVLDIDGVAREIVQPGQPALEELVARFGRDILLADGSLDRPKLAEVVFQDDDARLDLERITHPRVAARVAERIQALVQGHEVPAPQLIVVDHPLLVETGQAVRFQAVVVVEADIESRVRRLVESRGMPEEDVRARLRIQSSDEERRAVATHVIDNNGDLASLYAQVDEVHADLLTRAQATSAG
ncbi:MAG: dephospho-CoA kinase [Nitriliruptor sp.]|nr:MAG: dephospho-CoA kinase [Nitriliruptor sp.]